MSTARKRRNGFLCYAHADGKSPSRQYVEGLQVHLTQTVGDLEHQPWCDRDIPAGDQWPTMIRAALDTAAYAVFFVNSRFLASPFVTEVEVPALLDAARRDGVRLFALWVTDCNPPPWLQAVTFANERARPLAGMREHNLEKVYADLARLIAEYLAEDPDLFSSVRLMQQMAPGTVAGSTPGLAGPGSPSDDSTSRMDLADALSQQIAKDLAGIHARYRRGARTAAIADLDGLLALPAWPHLAASLRGRLLRTAALYRLDFGQDQAGAETLAGRAAAEDPDGDGQVLAAHLALHRGDNTAAAALLEPPNSPQARHLKAAMLIEADDAAAALAILVPSDDSGTVDEAPDQASGDAAADQTSTTAENCRLRALALLVLKRLPDAVAAIDEARALAPDWIAVRSAVAVIDFWRACTPAALTLTGQPLWPMPFSRALVRADAGARFADIAQTFATVADSLPTGSPDRRHWLTWRLLALLAAGGRRDDATALAEGLIGGAERMHPWPLLWARFYELDLDRARLMQRLQAVPTDDANFIPLTGLSLELRLEAGEAEAVLADLDALTPVVAQLGHPEVGAHWRVLALGAAGRHDEALAFADTIADERARLRLRLQIARDRERDQPGGYKAAAAAFFAAYPGPDTLAEACEAHAAAGGWAFIAAHADDLLRAVPTPGSLRLLAIATFNQAEYPRCLRALDEHREVYPDGRLPGDLALLRVRCQRMLGEVSDAAREARRLWEQERSPERLVELLNVQLESANTEGILEALQHLALLEPADGHLLLQAARLAVQYDRDLSARLWRRAVAHPTDQPEFVVQAFMLGEGLGLPGEEVKPWFQRMQAQAASGSGGVRLLHLSEMPGLLREQQEGQSVLLDKLWHGEAGLATLPRGFWQPLPAVLHADPEHNRAGADPLLQRPVLIRHGARALGEWLRRRAHRPRLILDLTALVTAHSLGLLDQVERAFRPLWLHRQWHLLLRSEIERINPVQPQRLAIHAEIGQLVRAGGIGLIDLTVLPIGDAMLTALVGETDARNLEWARSNAARLLTYLPLHGPDIEHWQEVEPPPPWGNLLLGPRALLNGLLGEALIDPQRHEAALAAFPPEPEVEGLTPLPPRGAALLSNTTLLGQFAELDLLTALSHRFRLHITVQDWQRDQDAAENDSRRIALARWTEGLIDRVSAGLRDGRYRPLPCAGEGRDDAEPKFSGLGELLSHPGGPGDLLWVDDRFINGYPSTGTTPIIGIVEVLELLFARGAINRKQRILWLNRLRVSDYRFIPLDAEEVLHWLRQAQLKGNSLAVPTELEVIARYWAVCLYQGDALQWGGNERHPNGELPFFVASQSAIRTALTAIWSDKTLKKGLREQRADWLLDNLYVGVADVPHLGPAPSPERDLSLVGMDLAGLCFGAFAVLLRCIGQTKGGGKGQRKASPPDGQAKRAIDQALDAAAAYLRWICARIVAPRLRADPEAVVPTAAALRSLILGSYSRDEGTLALIGGWLLRFLPALPPILQRALDKDQDLMQRLGLTETPVIELDDLRFASHEFWSAVEMALSGSEANLHGDQGQAFALRVVSAENDDRPTLRLADETGKSILEGNFEYSELLFARREPRLRALRANPQWWDGDQDGYEALERRLAVLMPPERRIKAISETAGRSADAHYHAVAKQWQCDHGMSLERCFAPPLAAVLTYLRCQGEADSTGFDTAVLWRRLVESIPPERGLAEPLRRIALLPCPLPAEVHLRLGELNADQTADLCGTLVTMLTDPVGRLHLIDLLLGVAPRWPAAMELAQAQIAHVASARFDTEVELVKALVDLAYRGFGNQGADAEARPRSRLAAAWGHAGRIAGVLLAGPVDPASVAEKMRAWNPFPHRSLYAFAQEPMQDLAWPWHVEATDLRYVALGRVLAQHPEAVAGLDLSPLRDRWPRCEPDALGEVHLLADPALFTDILHCLWGGDRSVHLALLLDSDNAAQLSPVAFTARIDELLTLLTADSLQSSHWQALWLTIRHGRLSGPDADCLAAVLDRVDLAKLTDADPMFQMPLVELAVRHTTHPAVLAEQLIRWAAGLDTDVQPGPRFREQFGEAVLVERLVHWLHGLATRDPDDPDAEFARLLESAIRCSRSFAGQVRDLLIGVTRGLPYSRHRALRRTLLAARSRPAPQAPQTEKTQQMKWERKSMRERRSGPKQPRS